MTGKRGMKGFNIVSLPYKIRVYSNNQVLIPAKLVRSLNLENVSEAYISFRHGENVVKIKARLLKTRHTDSRQFTIPKGIRERYQINPGDEVEIIDIAPA